MRRAFWEGHIEAWRVSRGKVSNGPCPGELTTVALAREGRPEEPTAGQGTLGGKGG